MFIKLALHTIIALIITLVVWIGTILAFDLFLGVGDMTAIITSLGMILGLFSGTMYLRKFLDPTI